MIRVLIVEDDPMVASINTEYIERLPDFSVVGTAKNGKEALQRLASGEKIDLLILDVYMPQLDGLAMLEAVRQKFRSVDVIFVTAAREKPVIQRALQLGAVDYLIKPFTFERIRLALETYEQRFLLFSKGEEAEQQELDRLFASRAPQNDALPKGVHPMTLSQVERLVEEAPQGELAISGMAAELGVTLVTLRVYLDHLTEQGRLEKKTKHGGIGRPTYQYYKR